MEDLEDIAGIAGLFATRRMGDLFFYQTGKTLFRIFKVKSKLKKKREQKVESARCMGCLFWVLFPALMFLFFLIYVNIV